MAIIRINPGVSSGYGMPSLSTLMGSGVSGSVFDSINTNAHDALFAERFAGLHQNFMDLHVKPLEAVAREVGGLFNQATNPNVYRPLISENDFYAIPNCMELPIMMMPEMRKLLVEGRINGFGYTPEDIPEDDSFGRVLDRFHVPDVEAASNKDGYFTVTARFEEFDPVLDDTQFYALRRTRGAIRKLLEDTELDPTDIGTIRG
jgi:hypothetical protein